jgi:hypothetical protein
VSVSAPLAREERGAIVIVQAQGRNKADTYRSLAVKDVAVMGKMVLVASVSEQSSSIVVEDEVGEVVERKLRF